MNHEESRIQADIVQLLQAHNIFCHSCPNELAGQGKQAMLRTARFIAMGLRKGVADLIVWFPSTIAYVEVKTPTGRQSDHQKRFQKRCKHYGVPYHIVRSVEDMDALVQHYITNVPNLDNTTKQG